VDSGVEPARASLSSHRSCGIDGKIYVIGGVIYDDEGEAVVMDRVVMYDPAINSWQQMAAMPTARVCHSAAVLDGKIYVSGGFTTSRDLSDAFDAYDPVTNTCATFASLSEARADHASAAFNGRLYVFGGWAPGGRMDLVEVYSPASNIWARAAEPSAIDQVVAVAL
jgi:N-acetylneuraminic acid mutarotase